MLVRLFLSIAYCACIPCVQQVAGTLSQALQLCSSDSRTAQTACLASLPAVHSSPEVSATWHTRPVALCGTRECMTLCARGLCCVWVPRLEASTAARRPHHISPPLAVLSVCH